MTAVQGQVSSVFKRARFTKFTPSEGEHEREKDRRQNKTSETLFETSKKIFAFARCDWASNPADYGGRFI